MSNIRRYAKAVVAACGFIALVAGQVADGQVEVEALLTAVVGIVTTLGVILKRNEPAPPPGPGA